MSGVWKAHLCRAPNVIRSRARSHKENLGKCYPRKPGEGGLAAILTPHFPYPQAYRSPDHLQMEAP